MNATTTDPLFAGLNDKSITAIPATVEKQRYVTSVAPKAANPGKWVEQPRLPIPTGEHAVIECQTRLLAADDLHGAADSIEILSRNSIEEAHLFARNKLF